MTDQQRLVKLMIPEDGKLQVVLDTDTYNEIDDQFALAYLLLSSERLSTEAIYAAPFFNEKSTSPKDGMEKSYDEIYHVLHAMNFPERITVLKGSSQFWSIQGEAVSSPAALDLIDRAMEGGSEPLYVIAIGAPTNVASAIAIKPEIIEKIVVVWLGGHGTWMDSAKEFNLQGDLTASQFLFDCGVPLIQIPCAGVTSQLLVTVPELEAYLDGKNALCSMLCENVRLTHKNHFAYSRSLWDVGAVAYLINPDWFKDKVISAPRITVDYHWDWQDGRHSMKTCLALKRDAIIRDLYLKLLDI